MVVYYIKKSVMNALSIGWLKRRKFQVMINGNVRNECLRVWYIYIPGCVVRILYPHAHFAPGDKYNIMTWVHLCQVYHYRYPTPQPTDEQKCKPTFY